MTRDGHIVGTLAATVTVIVLGIVALGLFTSVAGVLIAGTVAAIVGSGASTIADPGRSKRNVVLVFGYVVALMITYVLLLQMTARYAAPGSRGGPGMNSP